MMQLEPRRPFTPYEVRFLCGTALLVLSFVGLFLAALLKAAY